MTWLERQVSKIKDHSGPIVMKSDHDEAAIIFGEVRDNNKNVVWLEITDNEKNDPVALGNILSDAVKRALGAKLFDYGLPYAYGLKVLENQLKLLGPFFFIVSEAELNIEFAKSVLELNRYGSKVILSLGSNAIIPELPKDTLLISTKNLDLTLEEAKLMATELEEKDFNDLWQKCDAKYLDFRTNLNRLISLPSPTIPSPSGNRVLDEFAFEVDPDLLLNVLIKQEKWLEVLEVAASLLPHRVPEIIAKAGYRYNELGQTKRLWELLSELPREIWENEDVLFWLLSSAFWQGKAEELRNTVETYLHTKAAPELRALYVGVLAKPTHQLVNAREAFSVRKSSNTAYILGNYEVNPEKRILLLKEALRLAEDASKGYEIVRNSIGLIRVFLLLGRHSDAFYWSRWAMSKSKVYDQQNSVLHLWLVVHWSYLKLLFGENESAFKTLSVEAKHLENVAPYQAYVYLEKLGDYMLSKGDAKRALSYYEKNWKSGTRLFLGRTAFNMVKPYVWLNRQKKAFEIIAQARTLLGSKSVIQESYLNLAFAMVVVTIDVEKGIRQLLKLNKEKTFVGWKVELKIHHALYLAWAYLAIGDKEKAKAAINVVKIDEKIVESGLLIFAGPQERFKKVWSLFRPKSSILELQFIGSEEKIWFNDDEVFLSPQEKEIIVVLAANKDGLRVEVLGRMLNPDARNLAPLKTAISKLRRKLPITKNVYRIAVDYDADFINIYSLIEGGEIDTAIGMYQQLLLPASSAPEISRMREILSESIRVAVLNSSNYYATLELAERMQDDLELWEKLLEIAPNSSTRIPYIKAIIKRIKSDWAS